MGHHRLSKNDTLLCFVDQRHSRFRIQSWWMNWLCVHPKLCRFLVKAAPVWLGWIFDKFVTIISVDVYCWRTKFTHKPKCKRTEYAAMVQFCSADIPHNMMFRFRLCMSSARIVSLSDSQEKKWWIYVMNTPIDGATGTVIDTCLYVVLAKFNDYSTKLHLIIVLFIWSIFLFS